MEIRIKTMPDLLEQYAKKTLNSRVYAVAKETPLEIAPNLSARLNNRIFLKREDLQPVFSLNTKIRHLIAIHHY